MLRTAGKVGDALDAEELVEFLDLACGAALRGDGVVVRQVHRGLRSRAGGFRGVHGGGDGRSGWGLDGVAWDVVGGWVGGTCDA